MYIYKTTNLVNGKIYVGQRSKEFKSSYLGSGKLIKLAIKKYGKKSFNIQILETVNSIKELDEKEKYWVSKLESTNPSIGYNICDGGNVKRLFGKNNGFFGRRHRESFKETMRGKRNPSYNDHNHPVMQLDLCGKEIQRFNSVKEAARTLWFDRSGIYQVCSGKRKTHKGFIFKYIAG